MKNTILWIDDIIPEGYTALILSHPTGIEYEVQAGGMACRHPSCEGFVINLGLYLQGFDDCAYICWVCGIECGDIEQANKDLITQKEVADQINEELKTWSHYEIRFDYDRLQETMEGWWPVTVKGTLNTFEKQKGFWKGYIHTKNCD